MGAPAVVIIPGASGLPKLYQGVIDAVKERGIENVQALHLLSVGLESGARPGPPPTMYDDAALIAEHVTKLADAGHDVVLVAHSYGGVPTTQSVKGLSKAARQEQGLPGGIVRIGYMTTLIPEQGQPAASLMALFPPENQVPMEVDEAGWIYYTDVTRSAQLSFNDFPLEEGKVWASKLVKHSAASFATPLTYAGYKDVAVSYLLCTADLTIPVEIQQKEIDMIERETGKKVDVTSIKSDHVPPISHPQEVIDWIVKLAELK
ncbi:alpha/beta-hydrolase [Apiospora arundinis]